MRHHLKMKPKLEEEIGVMDGPKVEDRHEELLLLEVVLEVPP